MRPIPSLLLTLCLLAGSVHAAELVSAADRPSGLALRNEGGSWTLLHDGAQPQPLRLPRHFHPYRVEALNDGWLLTGTVPAGKGRNLLVLRDNGRSLRILPALPNRTGRDLLNPVALIDGGELRGLAWIEGDRQSELSVRAAEWTGRDWGPVEEVSPRGSGWDAQLALAGAVLHDGDWLLLWAAFDGRDDEILWSRRRVAAWSPPTRLHEDNAEPDVTPTVVATDRGALAAWSFYQDEHYRLGIARLEDGTWTVDPASEEKGVTDPRAQRITDGLRISYESVIPDGTTSLEFDATGWLRGRQYTPRESSSPEREERLEPAGGDEFRYLAFGDSITAGSFDDPGGGGYPKRLKNMLGCSPGVCAVDNEGVGGERTGAGLSRINGVLNAGDYDIMMLMEGTNDIFRDPPISNNTIQSNLEQMASRATVREVDTVLASIIWFHPDGSRGTSRDDEVEDLKVRLQNVASDDDFYFANPWSVLCPDPPTGCFNQHYNIGGGDPVGHPDASGYDILADEFFETVTMNPVPGVPDLGSPTGNFFPPPTVYTWDRESPQRATWYQLKVEDETGTVHNMLYKADAVCGATTCVKVLNLGLQGGNHTWRVRGRNPLGFGNWSEDGEFWVRERMPFEEQ